MVNKHLAVYLNDHLAGSVGVLELLPHLEAAHAGTDLERILAELRADITADRLELESLMRRLQIAQSVPRKAAAWLAEKISQLKLKLDDTEQGPMHLLESLDMVAVGIEGKRSLWQSLTTVAEQVPGLQGIDYDRLVKRAEEQRQRLEAIRLQAARAAFGDMR